MNAPIKLNPDGPDEHGSFTHPQDCMCHDCLPGSNRLPTTGETCPVCDDSGGVDSGSITPWGAPITLPCPSCVEDTGFKRAVETEQPKLGAKERDSYTKMFAEHTKEIATLRAENKGLRATIEDTIKTKDASIQHFKDCAIAERNIKEERSADCGRYITTISKLESENQGLVKEVKRLREVLNQCRCALVGYKMTHRLHEESVLNKALVAAQEALKPTF